MASDYNSRKSLALNVDDELLKENDCLIYKLDDDELNEFRWIG